MDRKVVEIQPLSRMLGKKQMKDPHRFLAQVLLRKKCMKMKDWRELVRGSDNEQNDAANWEQAYAVINENLALLKFELQRMTFEFDNEEYVAIVNVMVPSTSVEALAGEIKLKRIAPKQTPLCRVTNLSTWELLALDKILTEIIREGASEKSSLIHHLPSYTYNLKKEQVEALLENLKTELWLVPHITNTGAQLITLGPRSLIELSTYINGLLGDMPDGDKRKCGICRQLVLGGVQCGECHSRLHVKCAESVQACCNGKCLRRFPVPKVALELPYRVASERAAVAGGGGGGGGAAHRRQAARAEEEEEEEENEDEDADAEQVGEAAGEQSDDDVASTNQQQRSRRLNMEQGEPSEVEDEGAPQRKRRRR